MGGESEDHAAGRLARSAVVILEEDVAVVPDLGAEAGMELEVPDSETRALGSRTILKPTNSLRVRDAGKCHRSCDGDEEELFHRVCR